MTGIRLESQRGEHSRHEIDVGPEVGDRPVAARRDRPGLFDLRLEILELAPPYLDLPVAQSLLVGFRRCRRRVAARFKHYSAKVRIRHFRRRIAGLCRRGRPVQPKTLDSPKHPLAFGRKPPSSVSGSDSTGCSGRSTPSAPSTDFGWNSRMRQPPPSGRRRAIPRIRRMPKPRDIRGAPPDGKLLLDLDPHSFGQDKPAGNHEYASIFGFDFCLFGSCWQKIRSSKL